MQVCTVLCRQARLHTGPGRHPGMPHVHARTHARTNARTHEPMSGRTTAPTACLSGRKSRRLWRSSRAQMFFLGTCRRHHRGGFRPIMGKDLSVDNMSLVVASPCANSRPIPFGGWRSKEISALQQQQQWTTRRKKHKPNGMRTQHAARRMRPTLGMHMYMSTAADDAMDLNIEQQQVVDFALEGAHVCVWACGRAGARAGRWTGRRLVCASASRPGTRQELDAWPPACPSAVALCPSPAAPCATRPLAHLPTPFH